MIQIPSEYESRFSDENLRIDLLEGNVIGLLEEDLASQNDRLRTLRDLESQGRLQFSEPLRRRGIIDHFPEVKRVTDEFLDSKDVGCPKIAVEDRILPLNLQPDNFNLLGLITYGMPLVLAGQGFEFAHSGDIESAILAPLIGLGTCGILPIVRYLNPIRDSFRPRDNVVTIVQNPLESQLPALAHEYTHFVQRKRSFGIKSSGIKEGIARGSDQYVSSFFAQKSGNQGYLFDTTCRNVQELLHVYKWLCEETGNIAQDELFEFAPALSEVYKLEGVPRLHSLGNTYCRLLAATHGQSVYADLINGRFEI